jgi:hypothetical protein
MTVAPCLAVPVGTQSSPRTQRPQRKRGMTFFPAFALSAFFAIFAS